MASCGTCGTVEELDIHGDTNLFYECRVCFEELTAQIIVLTEALRDWMAIWETGADYDGGEYDPDDVVQVQCAKTHALLADLPEAAHIAQDAAQFEKGIASVLRIRCIEHRAVPQYNESESAGGECAACTVEPLREVLQAVEWGTDWPDFCGVCREWKADGHAVGCALGAALP